MSIIFEVSRDPRLLGQYYALREQCFRNELGIPGFDGSEQEQDRQGQILLAHEHGNVIGGVRISSQLPFQSAPPNLDLDANTSCIWERFALDPAIRTVQLTRDFIARLIEISSVLGYRTAVVLSSLRNARFYRLCHTALGIPFEIHRPAPEYAQGAFSGLEHYLSISHLRDEVRLQLVA